MFKKSMLAIALTAAAGAAQASLIDITPSIDLTGATAFFPDGVNAEGFDSADLKAPDAAITVEQRVAAAAPVQFGLDGTALVNAGLGERSVVYVSDVALADGLTLRFKAANGQLQADNNLALAVWSPSEGLVKVASLNDFVAGDNNGWAEAVLQLDLSAAATAGDVLDPSGQIPLKTPMALVSENAGNYTNPGFILNKDVSVGQSLTLAMTEAKNTSAVDLVAPRAAAENIATVINTTALEVTAVTSTIDVEYNNDPDQSRHGFENDHIRDAATYAAHPTPSPLNSEALLGLNVGSAEITFADADYTLSLSRDNNAGVVAVEYAGINMPFVNGSYVLPQQTMTATPLNPANTLDIEVSGDTVLATGSWTATLELTPHNNLTSQAAFVGTAAQLQAFSEDKTSHIWGINGAQFKVPYHAQNAAGYNFFLKVVNESENDAAVFADVIVDNNKGNSVVVENVKIGTAAATGNTTIGQKAILDAVVAASNGAVVADELAHLAMTLTVIAPKNSVQVTGFQSDAVGRTSVPVYVPTEDPTSGRVWFQ